MKKLRFLWNKLISTFWFIPVLILALTALLATVLLWVDAQVQIPVDHPLHDFLIDSPDSARSILTTIAGAMIGVAGTVFSITLVVLTLAYSQFGSRLIRNFMYDRLNQVVLGTYIATFLYCLIVLPAIHENEGTIFIPTFSIGFALLASVANIILLIVFIHHIAVGIQADKVVFDISESLLKRIKTLFPHTEDGEHPEEAAAIDREKIDSEYGKVQAFLAPSSGYLQYIDYEALLAVAKDNDLVIELFYRPGGYLVRGVELGKIYSNAVPDKALIDQLNGQFITGKVRTQQQDAEHAIHQLVEIAARALSPGVNDPFTAIACIDNLGSTMAYLGRVRFPSAYRYDSDNRLRLIVDTLTYEGMLNAAFNQVRQYATGMPSVAIRLMEALELLHRAASRPEQKKALERHAKMVLNMGKDSFSETEDYKDLEQRGKRVLG